MSLRRTKATFASFLFPYLLIRMVQLVYVRQIDIYLKQNGRPLKF